MPKKKRKPRAGQFGAAAAAGPPKRSKAAERKKAGATQLAVLSQDKGAVGNSIAETAGSFGEAARATQRRRVAEAVATRLFDEALRELGMEELCGAAVRVVMEGVIKMVEQRAAWRAWRHQQRWERRKAALKKACWGCIQDGLNASLRMQGKPARVHKLGMFGGSPADKALRSGRVCGRHSYEERRLRRQLAATSETMVTGWSGPLLHVAGTRLDPIGDGGYGPIDGYYVETESDDVLGVPLAAGDTVTCDTDDGLEQATVLGLSASDSLLYTNIVYSLPPESGEVRVLFADGDIVDLPVVELSYCEQGSGKCFTCGTRCRPFLAGRPDRNYYLHISRGREIYWIWDGCMREQQREEVCVCEQEEVCVCEQSFHKEQLAAAYRGCWVMGRPPPRSGGSKTLHAPAARKLGRWIDGLRGFQARGWRPDHRDIYSNMRPTTIHGKFSPNPIPTIYEAYESFDVNDDGIISALHAGALGEPPSTGWQLSGHNSGVDILGYKLAGNRGARFPHAQQTRTWPRASALIWHVWGGFQPVALLCVCPAYRGNGGGLDANRGICRAENRPKRAK